MSAGKLKLNVVRIGNAVDTLHFRQAQRARFVQDKTRAVRQIDGNGAVRTRFYHRALGQTLSGGDRLAGTGDCSRHFRDRGGFGADLQPTVGNVDGGAGLDAVFVGTLVAQLDVVPPIRLAQQAFAQADEGVTRLGDVGEI